jgi:hypothetical protein
MTLIKKPETINISHLEKQIQDIPTELIFNLDEIRAQEWTGCRLRGIIILHLKIFHWFEFAIFRLQKYISCIAAISIVEDTIVILVVIHGMTNDVAIAKKEWRDSQHLLIRSNHMLCRIWEIFKKHITKSYGNTPRLRENQCVSVLFQLCFFSITVDRRLIMK